MILIGPSGYFKQQNLKICLEQAKQNGLELVYLRDFHEGSPAFLMGSKEERLKELALAETMPQKALLAIRGGVGAIELWDSYNPSIYKNSNKILIGYSDITILHFKRFFEGQILGIHAPVLSNIFDNPSYILSNINLLLEQQYNKITYPALSSVANQKDIKGEIIIMNLASLQSILGLFDIKIFKNKILAIEDINEPHYKVHRMLYQLFHIGMFEQISGLVLGYFSQDRTNIIKESVIPLAHKTNLPVFDWPIFGHDIPNWPLMFGKSVVIEKQPDGFYKLSYDL